MRANSKWHYHNRLILLLILTVLCALTVIAQEDDHLRLPQLEQLSEDNAGEIVSIAVLEWGSLTLDFSPDSKILAILDIENSTPGSLEGRTEQIILWNMESPGEQHISIGEQDFLTHTLEFSPDGLRLAIGSQTGDIFIWNMETRQIERTLEWHDTLIHDLAFDPRGDLLASASSGFHNIEGTESLRIWRIESGSRFFMLQPELNYSVTSVTFSPDGQLFAVGIGNSVQIWDVVKRTPLAILEAHQTWTEDLAFNSEGTLLVSSDTFAVCVWNVEAALSGENALLTTITSNSGFSSMDFSPNGEMIVTGDRENMVRLWNTETGEEITALNNHRDWVNDVTFSPDGRMLASTGLDHTTWLWGVPSDIP